MEFMQVVADSPKYGKITHIFRKWTGLDGTDEFRKVFVRRVPEDSFRATILESWWEHTPDRKLYRSTGKVATSTTLCEWLVTMDNLMEHKQEALKSFLDSYVILGGELCAEEHQEPAYYYTGESLMPVTLPFSDCPAKEVSEGDQPKSANPANLNTLYSFRFDEVPLLLDACGYSEDSVLWLEKHSIECVCPDYQSHLYTRDVRIAECLWLQVRAACPDETDDEVSAIVAEAMVDKNQLWTEMDFICPGNLYKWALRAEERR